MGAAISYLLPYVQKYAGKAVLITVSVVAISGALVYGHHKIDQGGYDRAVTEYQNKSQKLLAEKHKEVDAINQENAKRSYNAAKAYADHATNFQRDVDNLTKRMSISAGSCRNTMPNLPVDTAGREERHVEIDSGIEKTIIELANKCQFWIDQIPVSE